MLTAEIIVMWVAIFLFTTVYGLLRHRRLSRRIVAVALGTATFLAALAAAFPIDQPPSAPQVLWRWLVHCALFSASIRLFARANWRSSLGAGFFSATCLALLWILS